MAVDNRVKINLCIAEIVELAGMENRTRAHYEGSFIMLGDKEEVGPDIEWYGHEGLMNTPARVAEAVVEGIKTVYGPQKLDPKVGGNITVLVESNYGKYRTLRTMGEVSMTHDNARTHRNLTQEELKPILVEILAALRPYYAAEKKGSS